MSRSERNLDDLAAVVTPKVVEEALDQAVARARDELADRLARAIVDRALAVPTSQPTSQPTDPVPDQPTVPARGTAREPTESRPASPSGTGLYAFAIMPARPVDLAGVPGIDGEAPLQIVQHGDLGLVVSRMRLDLMDDVSEDDLSETGALATLARRHDEVVRSVFEHGPVLPLRFGTVVADEDGARRLLEEQGPAARARLAHLDTHREWGVRLTRDPDEVAPDPDGDREQRRDMTGASYLASRREALQRSERAEQQAAALVARVEEALGRHAADVAHRGGGPGSGLLADLAYLVPGADEDAFVDAAERLSSEVAHEALVLEMTGPWPPYSFAGLQPDGPPGVVGSA